jgi:hypothetical protein
MAFVSITSAGCDGVPMLPRVRLPQWTTRGVRTSIIDTHLPEFQEENPLGNGIVK